ncbi:protoporphyrinogen oxidase, chloroplastic/mitochondrial isoform X2 [Durio zibethinus]|uniref:Protoporphyrinogen oxidase n=1 Tax=Durio zibethinus TaxID=66656 RepID=A0A6P6BB03_DURZI|nr:protoporphyrinogen oxidase, chloroplastic/mitochondrial isoform X2 [Durio zibethinus]
MASTKIQDKQTSAKRVAVVGAGVSGLAAAYKLRSHGLNVSVFEAEGRAGGKLRSVSREGLIWDEGANTMFQVILEPFLWKKSDASKVSDAYNQESVGRFFQRHFGQEVVDYLIDPFVAGTSAGDPQSLSMRHSFPEIWDLEQRFGSIIVGALKSKLSAKRENSGETKSSVKKNALRGSFSFQGGMQTLTDMLCKDLSKDELKLKSKILSLSYSHGEKSTLENWSLSHASDRDKRSQGSSFDAVIMTAPLCNVKEMKIMKGGKPFPLNFIPEVSYMPVSVIITTFKKENVKRPLEGFGVLVPSNEQQNGLKTLGTLFSSIMFPDRAPDNLYLYTTFVGGRRNKELAKASTDELKQIVTSDLRQLMGVEGEPTFLNHFYWSKAFPLYGRNYASVVEAIEKMERDLPGFFYAGNHKAGLSVGKAIASGCKAADLVISYLESSHQKDGSPSK